MTSSEFLASKNVPVVGMNQETIDNVAKAQGWVKEATSKIYDLYKSGKLTQSGNSESLSSGTMFANFRVQDAESLFDLLENKEIKAKLLEISEIQGKDLPKNVLNGNKASETVGLKYRLECVVSIPNGTSDSTQKVFFIHNKGSLLNKFGSHLLETTKGVLGEIATAKIAKYVIEERVILGLIP